MSKNSDIERIREIVGETESDPYEPFRKALAAYAPESPPQRKKITAGRFRLAILILILGLIGVAYGGYEYLGHRRTLEIRKASETKQISNMAAGYNASSAWREKLEQLNQPGINNVRETLTRDGHPLLLSVCVPQIAEIGKGNQVHFAEFGSPDPEIDFVLECSAEQIAKLRQSGADDGTEVAVIAAITSVEETGSDDSPFLARGRCLDFVVVNY
jgi:hypothetical protein